ncbi:MAG: peptidyl-prolyl cis-trans isomerase cyclophilin type [Gemmatimonadetes bacterium]|nr:peptidyl-prolyl cis-trans isomerase cyclophilin type [Gemmatimonadota bacterium]
MARARRLILIAVAAVSATSCLPAALRGCKQEAPNPNTAVPDSFVVAFETTRGRFDVMARKQWAPIGTDRFYTLVRAKHYDDARFFRVVKDFVAQFGLSGDPAVNDAWRVRCIADEPVKHSNTRGTIAYARGGPGTRSVQLFVNLKDNPKLDTLSGFGFPPIAEVVAGMPVVDSLYSGYGESSARSGPQPGREGPSQDTINTKGNAYLKAGWPKLDYIKTARVVQEWRSPARDTARR